MRTIVLALLLATTAFAADEIVGKRPYEMDWANRTQDLFPPLVDFENLDGWTVNTEAMAATFSRTREQQLWDQYVGKLTYRATGDGPTLSFGPPQPLKITGPFDAVSLWVYGNNWGYSPNPNKPPVTIQAVFTDSQGKDFPVTLGSVNWEQWYVLHERLTPEQIERVKDGATFKGFTITGGRNKSDMTLFFDNLAVFTEKFPPLTFEPRPERGIPMFPGQTTGTNTGPGKLPFPNRAQTILPDNLTKGFKTSVALQGKSFVFTYTGSDGTLTYALTPATGTFSDLTARWKGTNALRPCVDGGVYLQVGDKALAPDKIEALAPPSLKNNELTTRYRVSRDGVSADVTYVYRLWNKSLVIDTLCPGGNIAEVRYGHAEGTDNPRLVTNPYYHFGGSLSRPAVVVMGPPAKPLFLAGNTDWYLSNASQPFSVLEVKDGKVSYQGGTRYINKTDGKRNDVYERFFLTLSSRYEEVLPTPANPVSPYKSVAGTHVWRAHGAGNREADAAYWTNVWRHGMTECLITDHETGWRDGGESFTFRTRTAPGKGGDQGQIDYSNLMQRKLGFVYGPYNNYTDFAPVNEFWSYDLISRTPQNQLGSAWMRCYAPKPTRAVEYCAKLAPIIQSKFNFSTAYCDVHTAVAPWDRTDYDARVPGAGTFAGTFYAYGEIMLHQKNAWKGPVYSEGNHHFWYSGLTDGNYAQDRGYDIPDQPWLVDLDLRKMHDLCCNFGMGNPEMFYGRGEAAGDTPADRDTYVDRFLAATVAFGHPGFLMMEGGFQNGLRSYYMLQQLASSYTQSPVTSIRYLGEDGKLYDTSAAIANGAYKRNQIFTTYADGTETCVNGNKTERMKFGNVDLPPNGYIGSSSHDTAVFSGDRGPGTARFDLSESPKYVYLDGRGRFTRLGSHGASDGIGICRILPDNKFEIIPYKGADCGFAITATSAVALDKDNKEIGPAKLRTARGLTYVIPAEGAFSYLLTGELLPPAQALTSSRDEVVAGETVTIQGKQPHTFTIPADAKPGQRIWQQLENAWIDFTVVPLTESTATLQGNALTLTLTSNLAAPAPFAVAVKGGAEPRPSAVSQPAQSLSTTTLRPNQPTKVTFDLGQPAAEDAILLRVDITSGDLKQTLERGMRIVRAPVKLADLPASYDTGMCVRGASETPDFGKTSGHVVPRATTVGGVSKQAIFMHPPWQDGTGYVFAVYEAMTLPKQPLAFRASVGKGDGSYLGDGILYKLAVTDASGKDTIVAEKTVLTHEWTPLEADLTKWAGQTVRIKMISDVGPKDDSSGDWACWADMRLETLQPALTRFMDEQGEQYRREPAPFSAKGLTVDQLRAAKSGRLVYDGNGLSGTGEQYGSFAQLNGINLGNLAPAGGSETQGLWAEKVSIPLTPEAIKKLDRRNVFVLLNPGHDYFKVRRFWVELTLPDGRKVSTDIAPSAYTQPPGWAYAEGILVPFERNITVDLWFDL